MTSDTWPYALDFRGHPIVSCLLGATPGEEIKSWRSYVVLPQTRSGFNYELAAFRAGWKQLALGRWRKPEEPAQFLGDARALCYYIGVGPDWETWGHQPYRKRFTS